jgi:hypothetical protein
MIVRTALATTLMRMLDKTRPTRNPMLLGRRKEKKRR